MFCLKNILTVRSFFFFKLEVHTEALAAEASKDRKLREQSEHYSKQLENELEGLKVPFYFTFIKLNLLWPDRMLETFSKYLSW